MPRALLLIAHRGDPARAPENTLRSFRHAIRKGARAVEVDVGRTADGVWVAFHDATLRRLTGRPGRLAATPWARLARLRVRQHRIPRLAEVLALCRARRVAVFIDLKPTGHERALRQVLQRSGWLPHLSLGTYTPTALRRWRHLLPSQPVLWILTPRLPLTPQRLALARRLRLTGLAIHTSRASRAVVRRTHAAGLHLYVWTVRTPASLRRVRALGVDGIMSEVWP